MPIPMPEIPDDSDVIRALDELGWALSGGMGVVSISYVEIKAYMELTGEKLSPWEVTMVRRMSEAYCVGTNDKIAAYQGLVVKLGLASAQYMVSVNG